MLDRLQKSEISSLKLSKVFEEVSQSFQPSEDVLTSVS